MARACWTAGATARPISTGRSTPASSTPTCARRPKWPRWSTRSAMSRSVISPARWRSSIQSGAARSSGWAMRADAHRGVYRLQVALGAAGVGGAALALGAGVSSVRVAPAAAHRLEVAGLRFTYPAVNAAAAVLLALAALGAAVLVVMARAAAHQVRAQRRLVRTLHRATPLPGHPAVAVIDAPVPMAFCAGWLHPRVYVSTAALRVLSRDELAAVLAHEQHHRALRDPL